MLKQEAKRKSRNMYISGIAKSLYSKRLCIKLCCILRVDFVFLAWQQEVFSAHAFYEPL